MVDYLTREDVQSSLRAQVIDDLLDDDASDPEEIWENIVEEAGGIMKDHLMRFKIDDEFAKTGSARKKGIVFHMKNLVSYILYSRSPDDDIPARIIKDYNDSMETLRQVSAGKLSIDLPLVETDTDEDGNPDTKRTKFRFGGDKPRRF